MKIIKSIMAMASSSLKSFRQSFSFKDSSGYRFQGDFTLKKLELAIERARLGNPQDLARMFYHVKTRFASATESLSDLSELVSHCTMTFPPAGTKQKKAAIDEQQNFFYEQYSRQHEAERTSGGRSGLISELFGAYTEGISIIERRFAVSDQFGNMVKSESGQQTMTTFEVRKYEGKQYVFCPVYRRVPLYRIRFGVLGSFGDMNDVRIIDESNSSVSYSIKELNAEIPNSYIVHYHKFLDVPGTPPEQSLMMALCNLYVLISFPINSALQYMRNYGQPIMHAKTPRMSPTSGKDDEEPEDSDVSAIKSFFKGGIMGGGLITSQDVELTAIQAFKEGNLAAHQWVIKWAEEHSKIIVEGQTMTSTARSGGGLGEGQAMLHERTKYSRANAIAEKIAQTLQASEMAFLAGANFGDLLVNLQLTIEPEETKKEKLEKLILMSSVVPVSRRSIYEAGGEDEPGQNEECIMAVPSTLTIRQGKIDKNGILSEDVSKTQATQNN